MGSKYNAALELKKKSWFSSAISAASAVSIKDQTVCLETWTRLTRTVGGAVLLDTLRLLHKLNERGYTQ